MKQYVCKTTIEAVKISTAVKNEAGDWTILGENELHNIPSDQAKGFKFNKKDPGYLIRYGNGVVEHMTTAKFNKLYGECVNGTYDGVFDASASNADEAPHNDDNVTVKNKRGYDQSVKRSATVLPFVEDTDRVENRMFSAGDVDQHIPQRPIEQQPMRQPPRFLHPQPAQPQKSGGFINKMKNVTHSDALLALLFVISCGAFAVT